MGQSFIKPGSEVVRYDLLGLQSVFTPSKLISRHFRPGQVSYWLKSVLSGYYVIPDKRPDRLQLHVYCTDTERGRG